MAAPDESIPHLQVSIASALEFIAFGVLEAPPAVAASPGRMLSMEEAAGVLDALFNKANELLLADDSAGDAGYRLALAEARGVVDVRARRTVERKNRAVAAQKAAKTKVVSMFEPERDSRTAGAGDVEKDGGEGRETKGEAGERAVLVQAAEVLVGEGVEGREKGGDPDGKGSSRDKSNEVSVPDCGLGEEKAGLADAVPVARLAGKEGAERSGVSDAPSVVKPPVRAAPRDAGAGEGMREVVRSTRSSIFWGFLHREDLMR